MVRIITDSAADLEPRELAALDIACIPLTVQFGEQEYQENVSMNKEQFYQLLLRSGEAPKTAQASPQHLMDLFEEAHSRGEEAVYICLSSALSGTYQSACMVRDMLGYEGCHVVDSRNATGGQHILVEYAAALRDAGMDAAGIVAEVEKLRERIVLYACMDTLEYLYKGGRISHTVYRLGTLTNIKPIINVDREGRVEVPAKAMGMRKGMEFLCKRPELNRPDASQPFYVMYTNNKAVAETLAEKLQLSDPRYLQVGAAIGSHIGPEACGLVYVEQI